VATKRRRTREWPRALGAAAYHGIVGEYVRAVEAHTEGDPAAILVQTLVCIGNAMGRGPHFYVEDTRHGSNLFAVVVGDTAMARKGTSLDRAQKFVQAADAPWAMKNDGEGGLSTPEGLINAVRDGSGDGKEADAGVADKRLLAAMSEFGETLAKMRRIENPLSSTLRQAWDGKTLRVRTRNKPLVATDAHIAVIGHITEADLETLLETADIFNGFGNRFLWVMARRSKELPHGGSFRIESRPDLIRRLSEAIVWAEHRTKPIEFDANARKRWPAIYSDLGESKPGPFGAITDRAEPQVRRLALIYAALEKSARVKPVHLDAALEVWRYCEDSAAYLFTEAATDPLEARALRKLRKSRTWMSRSRLMGVLGDPPAYRLDSALTALVERGPVETRTIRTKGRPRVEYRFRGEGV
jgi:hypothetical protein